MLKVGESCSGDVPIAAPCEGEDAAATDISSAFARPKSRSFTVPPGVILMLAGFRSRWMMPRS